MPSKAARSKSQPPDLEDLAMGIGGAIFFGIGIWSGDCPVWALFVLAFAGIVGVASFVQWWRT
jgi:hypothetical protein